MQSMISVVTLTKDNEDKIADFLSRLKGFDQVVLLDTGSKDSTCKLAQEFENVKVYKSEFIGFGPLRNKGAKLAKNDWILALDSDEILSDELISFFQNPSLDPKKVYSFPFHNYFNGKWIKGCNWHPEKHTRLYHREKTGFSKDHVHERVIDNHLIESLIPHPICHYSYRDIDDFLVKMHRYSTLFALQNKGKKSSFTKAISHGIFAFIKSYFLKRGIFDGKEGFIISLYNAETAYYKYLKLAYLNKKCS